MIFKHKPCISSLQIQSNLDLVTNLVIPKTVTKSRVVTKFMVDTWWVSNIFKSNQDFKTMIYSKIIICLSVFQEQIFYYKLGNQMTPFFHEHESITFMSKEAFHKQIFHHKLSNLMASLFHAHNFYVQRSLLSTNLPSQIKQFNGFVLSWTQAHNL